MSLSMVETRVLLVSVVDNSTTAISLPLEMSTTSHGFVAPADRRLHLVVSARPGARILGIGRGHAREIDIDAALVAIAGITLGTGEGRAQTEAKDQETCGQCSRHGVAPRGVEVAYAGKRAPAWERRCHADRLTSQPVTGASRLTSVWFGLWEGKRCCGLGEVRIVREFPLAGRKTGFVADPDSCASGSATLSPSSARPTGEDECKLHLVSRRRVSLPF